MRPSLDDPDGEAVVHLATHAILGSNTTNAWKHV